MPHRPNAANGHLVRGSRVSLWVAGDTSLFDGMAQFGDQLGRPLDIAVVPIAGWGPRLSEGHMNAEQAAIACARTRARWALPVHWGSLHPPFMGRGATGWMDRPGPEFAIALQREAPECRLIDLRPGEVWQGAIES
jgi:L-ascorbate metabolism protein UlaG (beta-lactamase superfamily)